MNRLAAIRLRLVLGILLTAALIRSANTAKGNRLA
jgi:hypothetical protein